MKLIHSRKAWPVKAAQWNMDRDERRELAAGDEARLPADVNCRIQALEFR
jgi:hypothetical protein